MQGKRQEEMGDAGMINPVVGRWLRIFAGYWDCTITNYSRSSNALMIHSQGTSLKMRTIEEAAEVGFHLARIQEEVGSLHGSVNFKALAHGLVIRIVLENL